MPQSRWITLIIILAILLFGYLIGSSIMEGLGINKIITVIVASIILFGAVLFVISITEDRKIDPADIGMFFILAIFALFLIWGLKALGFVDSFPSLKTAIASMFPGGA